MESKHCTRYLSQTFCFDVGIECQDCWYFRSDDMSLFAVLPEVDTNPENLSFDEFTYDDLPF